MAMTLGQAVAFCRSALRDTEGDGYQTEDIRQAVRATLDELARVAPASLSNATAVVTASNPAFSFTAAGFRASRVLTARIGYAAVEVVPLEEVLDGLNVNTTAGAPEKLAFETHTSGLLYPVPSANATLTVLQRDPPAVLVDDNSDIGVPDQYARQALWWGVPALLRFAGREEAVASPMWGRFIEYAKSLRGSAVAASVKRRLPNADDFV